MMDKLKLLNGKNSPFSISKFPKAFPEYLMIFYIPETPGLTKKLMTKLCKDWEETLLKISKNIKTKLDLNFWKEALVETHKINRSD
jgi:hypothetical protein